MCEELRENTKGLYDRVTRDIPLYPFTLYECRKYLDSMECAVSDYDLLQIYMTTGGIPYYLKLFEKGFTVPQNIDRAYFAEGAPLRKEFDRLFTSIFISLLKVGVSAFARIMARMVHTAVKDIDSRMFFR